MHPKIKIKKLRNILGVLFIGLTLAITVSAPIILASDNGLIAKLPIGKSPEFGSPSDPAGDTSQLKLENLVFTVYQDVLYTIGAVAVMLIIYTGFRLVTAGGEDDVITKQKNYLLWSIIGLVLISMATQIDKVFFFGEDGDYEGSFLTDTERQLASSGVFNESVFIIISFIKIAIAVVAIFFIVRSGANMVVNGFNEDTLTKEKKNIAIGLGSLLGINLVSTVVNKVLLSININTADPELQLQPGIKEIIGITNIAVTFVGPIAILSLIAGSAYYMFSLGDDEKTSKAKKIIINSIIGILIIYGAFGFVTTFISGTIEGTSNAQNN